MRNDTLCCRLVLRKLVPFLIVAVEGVGGGGRTGPISNSVLAGVSSGRGGGGGGRGGVTGTTVGLRKEEKSNKNKQLLETQRNVFYIWNFIYKKDYYPVCPPSAPTLADGPGL